MDFNKDSKLTDILEQYPWLPDELVKMNSGFKVIMTPIGKMMIKNATLADLSKKIGISDDEVIEQLQKMIDEHEG